MTTAGISIGIEVPAVDACTDVIEKCGGKTPVSKVGPPRGGLVCCVRILRVTPLRFPTRSGYSVTKDPRYRSWTWVGRFSRAAATGADNEQNDRGQRAVLVPPPGPAAVQPPFCRFRATDGLKVSGSASFMVKPLSILVNDLGTEICVIRESRLSPGLS